MIVLVRLVFVLEEGLPQLQKYFWTVVTRFIVCFQRETAVEYVFMYLVDFCLEKQSILV